MNRDMSGKLLNNNELYSGKETSTSKDEQLSINSNC